MYSALGIFYVHLTESHFAVIIKQIRGERRTADVGIGQRKKNHGILP